jgi:hypothetical protein
MLKIPVSCRKYFFQKLTQFSQGSNVLGFCFLHRLFSFERYMCFFNSAELAYLEQSEPMCTLKPLTCRSIPFKNLLNSHRETMCLMLLLLTQIGFFPELHVYLQLSWIGLWTKWAFPHLEHDDSQEMLPSKTYSVLTVKKCTRCSCF